MSININIIENDEKNENNEINETEVNLVTNMKINEMTSYNELDNFVAKQLDYQENYIMVDLKKIADYYEISTRKMRKEELIQEIIIYEIDPSHSETVFKRLQAWSWLKELKEDQKLKQYILF